METSGCLRLFGLMLTAIALVATGLILVVN
jgi:hypothetical protein